MEWQISELKRKGVNIIKETEVDPKLVKKENPDKIIVATGGKSVSLDESICNQDCYNAMDVLSGQIPEENKVLVCGAGLAGSEVAMYLAEDYDKEVVLIDQLSEIVPAVSPFTQMVIKSRLIEDGVEIKTDHCIEEINCDGVKCNNEEKMIEIKSEAVVLCLGMKADNELSTELKNSNEINKKVITVGDAVKPRKVFEAVHEGFHAGRKV